MEESKEDLTNLSWLIFIYQNKITIQEVNPYCQAHDNQGTSAFKNTYLEGLTKSQLQTMYQWQTMCYKLFPLPNAFGSYGAISLFWTVSKIEISSWTTSQWPGPTAQTTRSPISQGTTVPSKHRNLLVWLLRRALLHEGCKMLLIRCGDGPHPFSVLGLLFLYPRPFLFSFDRRAPCRSGISKSERWRQSG